MTLTGKEGRGGEGKGGVGAIANDVLNFRKIIGFL